MVHHPIMKIGRRLWLNKGRNRNGVLPPSLMVVGVVAVMTLQQIVVTIHDE
jgi:hypothetical protein